MRRKRTCFPFGCEVTRHGSMASRRECDGRTPSSPRLGFDAARADGGLAIRTAHGRSLRHREQLPCGPRLGAGSRNDLQRRLPSDPRQQARCARPLLRGNLAGGLGRDRSDCGTRPVRSVHLHRGLSAHHQPVWRAGGGILHLLLQPRSWVGRHGARHDRYRRRDHGSRPLTHGAARERGAIPLTLPSHGAGLLRADASA